MSTSANVTMKSGSGCSMATVGWCLIAAGVFFLCAVILKDTRLVVFGIKTEGVVLKTLYKETGIEDNEHYSIRFTPEGGEEMTVKTTVTYGPEMKEGQKVQVIYLRNNPNRAQIYSGRQLWLPLLTGFFVGGCCLISGIFLVNFHKVMRN